MRYLIAGLGNIGEEYQNSRHNIGFIILDSIADKYSFAFNSGRHAFIAKHRIKNRVFFYIKPTTYMNNSGKAIRYWLNELKIPIENLLVVCDDIALPFGRIRLRNKGSDGGHNGLFSIIEFLETNEYARLRFGIGDDFSKGRQVEYVLGNWTDEEKNDLSDFILKSITAINDFAFHGIGKAMTLHNKK